MLAQLEESVLVIVDMQPTFLEPIHRRDEVLHRVKFLAECARLLEVPMLYTEQYAERMGGTEDELKRLIGKDGFGKKAFSCSGSEEFVSAITGLAKDHVVLCGVETHICVNQTAQDLLDDDFDIFLAVDACSSRSQEMHDIGVARLRDVGVQAAHSESIVYEWMKSADHPDFRDVLKVVKAYS